MFKDTVKYLQPNPVKTRGHGGEGAGAMHQNTRGMDAGGGEKKGKGNLGGGPSKKKVSKEPGPLKAALGVGGV